MARPRKFDPEDVLDRALRLFRENGYEATSVQALVDATDLTRSSLYGAFGDKSALYLAALDRYGQRKTRRLARQLENIGGSPLGQIRTVLEETAEDCERGPGCFLVDAAVERARHCPEAGKQAAAGLRAIEDAFADAVRLAQRAGEVDPSLDAEAAGRTLVNTYRGLCATAHLPDARDARSSVIGVTLSGLQSAQLP